MKVFDIEFSDWERYYGIYENTEYARVGSSDVLGCNNEVNISEVCIEMSYNDTWIVSFNGKLSALNKTYNSLFPNPKKR